MELFELLRSSGKESSTLVGRIQVAGGGGGRVRLRFVRCDLERSNS